MEGEVERSRYSKAFLVSAKNVSTQMSVLSEGKRRTIVGSCESYILLKKAS